MMTFWQFTLRYPWAGLFIMLVSAAIAVALLRAVVRLAVRVVRVTGALVRRLMFPVPAGQLLCPVCGYDIRYTPHRCPECGTKLMWGLLPTARDLKRGNPRWR